MGAEVIIEYTSTRGRVVRQRDRERSLVLDGMFHVGERDTV